MLSPRHGQRRLGLHKGLTGAEVLLQPTDQVLRRDPGKALAARRVVRAQRPDAEHGGNAQVATGRFPALQQGKELLVDRLLHGTLIQATRQQGHPIDGKRANPFADHGPAEQFASRLLAFQQRLQQRQSLRTPRQPQRQRRRLAHLLVIARQTFSQHRQQRHAIAIQAQLGQGHQASRLQIAMAIRSNRRQQRRHNLVSTIDRRHRMRRQVHPRAPRAQKIIIPPQYPVPAQE